jgi:hypothetical protein
MPRGIGRPETGPSKKRQAALHETIAAVAKSGDASIGDLDRRLREQNVRSMQLSQATREVMAETGARRRKGRITRSMLSQRTPGGYD